MKKRTLTLQAEKPAVKYYCAGALLSVLIGLVAFAPIWLPNEGRLMEYGDYYPQYVPFLLEMKRMVASGSLGWSWNSFLGDSFVSAYSYYTVFNPFAWFVILFPESMLLYATMFTALLKLALGTVGAMLYLRQFVRKDSHALIGGLLYTFSSFTVVNTNFYFFQDVATLFPYMMYGLECLVRENKRWIYVIALAVSAATNFYFFVSTVFVVVLYVLFRLELYRPRGWKQNWEAFIRIAVCSILGTGLAGIALIPSLFSILGSGKAAASLGNALNVRYFTKEDTLERLRVLLAPIESGTYHAFYNSSSWCSIAAYLPIFGCLPAVQWGLKKRDWLGKLLALMLVCYMLPVLNSVFNLFSSAHYTRWLYGPVLLMALSVSLLLEEWEQTEAGLDRKGLVVYTLVACGLVLIPAVCNILCSFGYCFGGGCESDYYFGSRMVVIMTVLTAGNYLLLWYFANWKKYDFHRMLIWIVLACTVNYTVFNQINYDPYYESYYRITFVEGMHEPETEYSYRIDHPKTSMNYCLFQNQPGVHNYNSLQNLGATRFAMNSGFISNMSTVFLNVPQESREELDALLSVRYFVDFWMEDEVPDGFTYRRSENGVDVYENDNYIPMGFVYEDYVLQEQLDDLAPAEKVKVMLSSLVIGEEHIPVVSRMLPAAQPETEGFSLEEAVAERRRSVCSDFVGTPEGFRAQIHLDKDNVVFFSVPMDDGWEITVNGEHTEPVQIHYGLLGIVCESGENSIEAVYHTKGLAHGVGCSTLFALAWLIWEVAAARKKKKQ